MEKDTSVADRLARMKVKYIIFILIIFLEVFKFFFLYIKVQNDPTVKTLHQPAPFTSYLVLSVRLDLYNSTFSFQISVALTRLGFVMRF